MLLLSVFGILIFARIAASSGALTSAQKLQLSKKPYPSTNNPNGLDTYTEEEFNKLPIFRQKVADKLTFDYMFENRYLVRFLRQADLDVGKAVALMEANLLWRKRKNMDSVVDEDFTKYQRGSPYFFNLDNEGRPGMLTGIRDLDIRRIVLSGEIDEFLKFVLSSLEHANYILPSYTNFTGKEYIAGNLVYNAAGFNAKSHMCVRCVKFWLDLLLSIANYYPYIAKRLIFINVPRIADTLIDTLKPLMPPQFANSLQFYGVDKADWAKAVQLYPKNELPTDFGGTAPKPFWKSIWIKNPDTFGPEEVKKFTPKYLVQHSQ